MKDSFTIRAAKNFILFVSLLTLSECQRLNSALTRQHRKKLDKDIFHPQGTINGRSFIGGFYPNLKNRGRPHRVGRRPQLQPPRGNLGRMSNVGVPDRFSRRLGKTLQKSLHNRIMKGLPQSGGRGLGAMGVMGRASQLGSFGNGRNSMSRANSASAYLPRMPLKHNGNKHIGGRRQNHRRRHPIKFGHKGQGNLMNRSKVPYRKPIKKNGKVFGRSSMGKSGMIQAHSNNIDQGLLNSLLGLPLHQKIPNPFGEVPSSKMIPPSPPHIKSLSLPQIQVHPVQALPGAPQFPLMIGLQGPLFEQEKQESSDFFKLFSQPAVTHMVGDSAVQMEKKILISSLGAQVAMNPVVQFSNNAVKTENLIEIKHGGNSQPIILKAGGVIKIGDTNHHSVPLAILTEKERDDEGIRISKPKPKPKPKPKKKKPQKRKKPKKNEEKPKANKTKKSTATEATPTKTTTESLLDYLNAISDILE